LDNGNYDDDNLPGTPLAHQLPNEFQYTVRSFLGDQLYLCITSYSPI